jgi:hypothetical protein
MEEYLLIYYINSRRLCVRAFRSRNRGPEIGVFFLFFFFFPPFSCGLPWVNTRGFFFFFSHPFLAGCPGLITRVFFFFSLPPFSGGLPRVNTTVFFFFRPFPAGCPELIPEFVEKKKEKGR